MTKLKPGDRVACRVQLGKIVSPYAQYDEEKEFEIIASDDEGYFFYVPHYIILHDTKIITSTHLKSLNIDKRFLDCYMLYTAFDNIQGVRGLLDGMSCADCHEFYSFAEANQEDGTLKCWRCRNYKTYI